MMKRIGINMDIYDLLLEDQEVNAWRYEPINFTIGRLRMAIQYKNKKRQLELLEKISKEIEERGIL